MHLFQQNNFDQLLTSNRLLFGIFYTKSTKLVSTKHNKRSSRIPDLVNFLYQMPVYQAIEYKHFDLAGIGPFLQFGHAYLLICKKQLVWRYSIKQKNSNQIGPVTFILLLEVLSLFNIQILHEFFTFKWEMTTLSSLWMCRWMWRWRWYWRGRGL